MNILYYSWDLNSEKKYADMLKLIDATVNFTTDEEFVVQSLEEGAVDVLIFDTTNILNYKKLFQYKVDKMDKIIYVAITSPTNSFILEEALAFGLNDYVYDGITKEAFLAKINALLYLLTRKTTFTSNAILKVKDLTLNPYTREAKRGDVEVSLTNKEYKLLELLVKNKNKVVTREMIAEKVWGKEIPDHKNIGDVYITFLRRKIEYGFPSKIIKTIRNVGYIIKD
ncbi:winged helix-turn-helix domain-containing protein [Streptobacillus canis]|uniref:winged helix-turn-helix domain-containing protein n=1 Tax=Streptobacillus canis TaxID=2678686 RepID=UPI0012E1BFCA|nr:response regulator transcription factor [Streptobacillus canis]